MDGQVPKRYIFLFECTSIHKIRATKKWGFKQLQFFFKWEIVYNLDSQAAIYLTKMKISPLCNVEVEIPFS